MTLIGIIAEIHMRTDCAKRLESELRWIADHFEEEFLPDRVFVLGDIIQHGKTPEEDLRNIRRVKSLLEDYSYRVIYLLGNHDVINLSRTELAETLGQKSFFGIADVGDYSFVCLDSSLKNTETPSGMIGPEQLAFVEEELPQVDSSFVLVHHPVGNFDLSENYWFTDFPEQAYLCDRKRLLEIMTQTGNVISTISGHIHSDEYTEFHDMSNLSMGAFSKETPHKPITGTYAELSLGETITAEIKVRNETIERYEL